MSSELKQIKDYLSKHPELTGTAKLASINDKICNILGVSNATTDEYTNNSDEVKDHITSGIPKSQWTPSMKKAVQTIDNSRVRCYSTWHYGYTHLEPTTPDDLIGAINDHAN